MVQHPQPDLAARAPDDAAHRRAVVGPGAMPFTLVRPPSGRILRVRVGPSLLARVDVHLIRLGHWVRQRRGGGGAARAALGWRGGGATSGGGRSAVHPRYACWACPA